MLISIDNDNLIRILLFASEYQPQKLKSYSIICKKFYNIITKTLPESCFRKYINPGETHCFNWEYVKREFSLIHASNGPIPEKVAPHEKWNTCPMYQDFKWIRASPETSYCIGLKKLTSDEKELHLFRIIPKLHKKKESLVDIIQVNTFTLTKTWKLKKYSVVYSDGHFIIPFTKGSERIKFLIIECKTGFMFPIVLEKTMLKLGSIRIRFIPDSKKILIYSGYPMRSCETHYVILGLNTPDKKIQVYREHFKTLKAHYILFTNSWIAIIRQNSKKKFTFHKLSLHSEKEQKIKLPSKKINYYDTLRTSDKQNIFAIATNNSLFEARTYYLINFDNSSVELKEYPFTFKTNNGPFNNSFFTLDIKPNDIIFHCAFDHKRNIYLEFTKDEYLKKLASKSDIHISKYCLLTKVLIIWNK